MSIGFNVDNMIQCMVGNTARDHGLNVQMIAAIEDVTGGGEGEEEEFISDSDISKQVK
jgi:hypothetical protein